MKWALLFPALFIGMIAPAQTKTFKGAWFEISYPTDFEARGSLPSATAEKGYESAFFESPDHLVEFYIFSPQWSGEAKDIALKDTEKFSFTSTKQSGSTVTRWWTIVAKDGSYTRSYQETRDNALNTIRIVGIRYKDQLAYNRYKEQYLAFKASLVQFAD